MKIRKGDTVQIIAGKDKGKTGSVLTALPRTEQVIIEGMNVVKKHQKNRRTRSQGQIIEKSLPIHVSNVALLEGDKPVRVGYSIEGEGEKRKKVRVARPSGKKL
ncbi:MAG: 50S ribosomal protein L24 [Candidatus Pacebacteria bacterium]|nr:50S ribosomal protein L24 [Candidatus Paceibacterota bacterium]